MQPSAFKKLWVEDTGDWTVAGDTARLKKGALGLRDIAAHFNHEKKKIDPVVTIIL